MTGAETFDGSRRGADEYVWYVSYGSNMCKRRFLAYVRGGTFPGAQKTYPGCRDTRLPVDSVAVAMEGFMFFAAEPRVWPSGGVAFFDPSVPGCTVGRGWLITAQQFEDVAVQECGGTPGADAPSVRVEDVLASGSTVGGGLYGRGLVVGSIEGAPAVTFTSPLGFVDALRPGTHITGREFFVNHPGPEYAAVLSSGVAEMLGDGLRLVRLGSTVGG